MPLDQHLGKVLQSLAAAARKPPQELTLKEGRFGYYALTFGSRTPQQIVEVGSVEDTEVQGGAGILKARVYRPKDSGPKPTVVFFHGGGFVLGDLDTHDNMCRDICKSSDSVVVSVAYRLSPESPFPAAVDDTLAATKWVIEHAAEFGGSAIVGVAGDSAGGNLAAVVSQQLAAEGLKLAAQFLIYPGVDDLDGDYPSRGENANGYFLEQETLNWFFAQYVGEWSDHKDPRLTPINASSFSNLPPTVIVTAEFDPLRDEAEVYGGKLRAAGVEVDVVRGNGMIHGFFDMGRWSPAAQSIIENTSSRFGELLRKA
ncbi:alpha/beta hydrolase [Pseudomonas aeruginosa]|uniref:alpha/beta hydrolase n=1 Tax=Pseudomonas aeruginosa TaxID=287 RepID=UPI000EB26ABF|nr:alpha/beta hydrolase [Pseudomonas aeruginosa]EIU1413948.1 alpha/beta hydrolase [Pseudomonas aeruginosa]MCG9956500.1 alpha/beta hydrolase [Pseudomonas aeruginosa]RPW10793.1 alpha/beta hydrolase [Pseudomonas aeruginosa]RTB51799.1 alpha/beta hydrolase [Pseudomonas aeruginosa]RTC34177.1 alpha/beta hydrolase [Pseudomonas aeruginosa]